MPTPDETWHQSLVVVISILLKLTSLKDLNKLEDEGIGFERLKKGKVFLCLHLGLNPGIQLDLDISELAVSVLLLVL